MSLSTWALWLFVSQPLTPNHGRFEALEALPRAAWLEVPASRALGSLRGLGPPGANLSPGGGLGVPRLTGVNRDRRFTWGRALDPSLALSLFAGVRRTSTHGGWRHRGWLHLTLVYVPGTPGRSPARAAPPPEAERTRRARCQGLRPRGAGPLARSRFSARWRALACGEVTP